LVLAGRSIDKMKNIFFAIIYIIPLNIFSQSIDTVYYDNNWKECNKDVAIFFGFKELDKDFSGVEKFYYMTGEIRATCPYKNGSKNGKAQMWFKNGQRYGEGIYKNGIKDSIWIHWYPNGIKADETYYKGDKKEIIGFWDDNGNRIYKITEVDKEPLFYDSKDKKQSDKLLVKFISENIIYPEIPKANKICGKVLLSFIIDEKGNSVNVEIVKGINEYLDKEATRIIEKLPKWKPAIYKNTEVRVKYIIPINFIL